MTDEQSSIGMKRHFVLRRTKNTAYVISSNADINEMTNILKLSTRANNKVEIKNTVQKMNSGLRVMEVRDITCTFHNKIQ